MIRMIQTILSNCLDDPSLKVEVSLSKNLKFGDYTSNLLLKYKIDEKQLLNQLNEESLFEKIEVVNGHLNFFITTSISEEVCVMNTHVNLLRMKQVYDRLVTENYTGTTHINSEWYPLIKSINLLMATQKRLGDVTQDEAALVVKTFMKIDDAYVYRLLDEASLSGIRAILEKCLKVLERNSDE